MIPIIGNRFFALNRSPWRKIRRTMIFYGNDYNDIPGTINATEEHFIIIEFRVSAKRKMEAKVPRGIIKSAYNPASKSTQNFMLPTWFLRKNKLYALRDDDVWE